MAAVDAGKPSVSLPPPGILDSFLSILFPLRCVHCGAGGAWLCPVCAGELLPVGPPACRRCGRPEAPRGCRPEAGRSRARVPEELRPGGSRSREPRNPAGRQPTGPCPECRGRRLPFESARAAYRFEGSARSLVHALKFGGQRRLAAYMAAISGDFACLTAGGKEVTLTYVPLHRSKLTQRGYNQAECYAKALSRRHGLPVRGLLVKLFPTPPQNQLGFDQRARNLRQGFGLKKRARDHRGRIVLVDDVYTTGSTVAACAAVLKRELNVPVDVWTFARTVKR